MLTYLWALGTMFSQKPFLERLFFVSLEVSLLVGLVELLTLTGVLKSSRLRSLLWLAVMLKASLGLFVAPAINYAVLAEPKPIAASMAPYTGQIRPTPVLPSTAPGASLPSPAVSAPVERKTPVAIPAGPPRARAWGATDLVPYLLPLWLGGVAFAGLLAILDRLKLRRIMQESEPPPGRVRDIFVGEARALNLYVMPRLLVTDLFKSPAVAGPLRPTVFLPNWMLNSRAETLSWAARHELTHCKLGDPLAQAVRVIAQALFFFHPLVWWAGRRWEQAAELACDRAMLKTESDVTRYAEQLLQVLARAGVSRRRALMTGLCATRNSVGNRIAALFTDPLRWAPHLNARKRLCVAAFLAAALFVGIRTTGREAHAQSAAPPPMPTAELPARTLQFPEDRSLGQLRFGSQAVEARGIVEIPGGVDVRLDINNTSLSELSCLAGLQPNDLQVITFSRTAVQDADLAYLSHLTGLRNVELPNTSIGNEGLWYLQDLTGLTRLNLNSTQVTDQGLAYLSNMTQMQELILNRTNVSDAGMAHLADMANLRYLDLWQANLTDEGLQQLSNLQNLELLGIEDTLVTDAGMQYLAELTNLEGLNLGKVAITDAGLETICGLTQLTMLNLNNTFITDEGLQLLAKLTNLQLLELPIQISPDAIRRLEGLPIYQQLAQKLQNARKQIRVREKGTGRPIPNAYFSVREFVEYAKGQGRMFFFSVDERGDATVYLPPTDTEIWIRCYADGYVTEEAAFPVPMPDVMTIELARGTTIGGTVVDMDGKPIGGAKVSLPVLGEHNWNSIESLPHQEVSDENGLWTCNITPPSLADFWITLDHPQYRTTIYYMQDLSEADLRNQTQVLVMAPPINLEGRVVDQKGAAIEGVRVTEVVTHRQNRLRAMPTYATSDENGAFVLGNVKLGPIKLRAEGPGFVPQVADLEVVGDMAPVEIVLVRARTLKGRVEDAQGKPLESVLVTCRAELSLWRQTTKTDGSFLWDEAPAQPVVATFSKDGYASVTTQLEPGETEHRIVMAGNAHGVLTGKITDAATGAPLKQAALWIGYQRRNGLKAWVGRVQLHLQDGHFTMEMPSATLAEDAAFLLVAAEVKGCYRELAEPVGTQQMLAAPVQRDFQMHRGPALTGRVVDGAGNPVPTATVVAAIPEFPVDLKPLKVVPPAKARAGITGEDGSFSLEPERLPVIVYAMTPDGFGSLLREDTEDSSEVVLAPWARLTVRDALPDIEAKSSAAQGSAFCTFAAPGEKRGSDAYFDRLMPGQAFFFGSAGKAAEKPPVLSLEIMPGEHRRVALGAAGVKVSGAVPSTAGAAGSHRSVIVTDSEKISHYSGLGDANAFEVPNVSEGEAELHVVKDLDFELLAVGRPPEPLYGTRINVMPQGTDQAQNLGDLDIMKLFRF
ncbi:MAG TPA: carboxypeptidase regulatory-like domain-containing protein [Candidatus Bathyarchaeia archaeon]|nr:carboxypeptidase regulatory-like domain-containing protein [Candidatus Bathyarchaeia archaeon]